MEDETGTRYRDICLLPVVRRIAAMLDIEPATISDGDPLPVNWHFPLLAAQTRKRDLRADGFPGLGVPMPDLGLPRLLLAGRTVSIRRALPIGGPIERLSAVRKIDHKDDARGPRAIVTLGHEIRAVDDAEAAIVETQTYMLLPTGRHAVVASPPPTHVTADHVRTVVPDATLLFHYSALGFNSHRIHLDREYAHEEGFPDLVVNGGLIALLLTEMARNDLGLKISSLRIKHTAPLFCDRPVTLAATRDGDGWVVRAHDDNGTIAAEATLECA
ncbi:mesaconyl-C(4)-CoA hydratase [soil metagenome]